MRAGRQTKYGAKAKQIPEYSVWMNMKDRCRNPKADNYKHYGAMGIKVCDRWSSFENFILDMGFRPTSKHRLDRKNVDGNYEPSNCRWATRAEDSANKRPYPNRISDAWLKQHNLAPVALVGWLRI